MKQRYPWPRGNKRSRQSVCTLVGSWRGHGCNRYRHGPAPHRRPHRCGALVLQGHQDGLCNVFVPHATAGVAIIETGAGSDDDLLDTLERLLPRDDRYRHAHGSPGHGADHVLPALVSPSVTVPVQGGKPLLGTWQSVRAGRPERRQSAAQGAAELHRRLSRHQKRRRFVGLSGRDRPRPVLWCGRIVAGNCETTLSDEEQ